MSGLELARLIHLLMYEPSLIRLHPVMCLFSPTTSQTRQSGRQYASRAIRRCFLRRRASYARLLRPGAKRAARCTFNLHLES